jgi:hypothetical protein
MHPAALPLFAANVSQVGGTIEVSSANMKSGWRTTGSTCIQQAPLQRTVLKGPLGCCKEGWQPFKYTSKAERPWTQQSPATWAGLLLPLLQFKHHISRTYSTAYKFGRSVCGGRMR